MRNQIIKNLTKINKNMLVYKVILTAYKDSERLEAIDFLERRLKELLSDMETYTNNHSKGDYAWLNNKIENDSYTFDEVLHEVEEYINNRCRILSIITLNNMSEIELVSFGKELERYLSKFKDIDEAAEFICFNSGALLTSFIDELINYIHNNEHLVNKKFIPMDFLENNRTIIVMDLKQWLDIFNNLKLSMSNIKNNNERSYKSLIENYNLLLMYYFIIITSPNFNS